MRHGLVLTLLVAVVLAAWGGGASSPEGPVGPRVVEQFPTGPQTRLEAATVDDDPPNIVLVLTDDQNTDELAWMPRTQQLLAEEGASLDETVSPHPLCCPARAELVTGQYAQNNGVRHNGGPHGGFAALDPQYPTIPERFQAAGYRTGLIGKYLNGYDGEGRPPEPGWDLWDPLVKGVYTYDRFSFLGDEPATWKQEENPYVTRSISQRTNAAVREMSADDEPFMLFSWHVAPHYRPQGKTHRPPPAAPADRRRFRGVDAPSLKRPNYNPEDVSEQPLPIRKRSMVRDAKNTYMFRGRIRSLQAVDRAVGSLVRTLRQTGELDNTYLVFASDNGYAMGEHRLFGKNVLTQQILRVPLLARGPGIPAGAASSAPASLVDVPATLVDLAGLDDRTGLDGTSLLGPMLTEEVEFRDTTLVQTGGRVGNGWQYRGVQTTRYLYALDENTGDGVLYDHAVDPWELENRVRDPAYAGVVEELEARAARLRRCEGNGCNLDFGAEPLPEPDPTSEDQDDRG